MCHPKPTARDTVPCPRGRQRDGPLGGQTRGPASPGRRPKATLRDVWVGRGPVWSLIPRSVTLQLCGLFGQSSTLDSVFREQWRTPRKCPVQQTGFFLARLLSAFNMLIAL